MNTIPHRPPILLVDEMELDGNKGVGRFYVDPAMPVLAGHFPGNPLFPGIYTLESMGQSAVVMAMSDPKYRNSLPLFFGAHNVRFFKPVRPGDHLLHQVDLLEELVDKARLAYWVECYVGEDKVANAEIQLAMR